MLNFGQRHSGCHETPGVKRHICQHCVLHHTWVRTLAVQGAEIGILFREVPGKKVRISLRAREGANVNKIANVFGGGGHKLAAGCSLDPPLADVEQQVIAEAVRQLNVTV